MEKTWQQIYTKKGVSEKFGKYETGVATIEQKNPTWHSSIIKKQQQIRNQTYAKAAERKGIRHGKQKHVQIINSIYNQSKKIKKKNKIKVLTLIQSETMKIC